MTSNFLKNKVLEHFRFKKNYYLCATEVRCYHHVADVIACNDVDIIDIEIKISYSDFLADFKKLKHKKIENHGYVYMYSNKLYYCVPAEIKKECLAYLKEKKLPYGLLSFNDVLSVLKSCRKINEISKAIINIIKRKIILRLSSEMIFLRQQKSCDKCGGIYNKPDLSGKVFV